MKKILIVISDMGLGGAQRSLLSFLKCMNASQQVTQYEINLMVVNPTGGFYAQIPQEIKQLMPPKALCWLGSTFSKRLLTKHFSVKCVFGKVKWMLKKKLGMFPERWNTQQKLWSCWKNQIPALAGYYDAAISYIDGFPNYYIMEKVSAKKKVLWIHNEYQKLQYDPEYDRPFYEKADRIITISDKCRQCILEVFPQFQEKVHILENISVSSEVLEKSGAGDCPEFLTYDGLKLLSVGRLNAQLRLAELAVFTHCFFSLNGIGECLAACAVDKDNKHLVIAFVYTFFKLFLKTELCNLCSLGHFGRIIYEM